MRKKHVKTLLTLCVLHWRLVFTGADGVPKESFRKATYFDDKLAHAIYDRYSKNVEPFECVNTETGEYGLCETRDLRISEIVGDRSQNVNAGE